MSDKISSRYVERQIRDLQPGVVVFVEVPAIEVDYENFCWIDLDAYPTMSPCLTACVMVAKEEDVFKLILSEAHLKGFEWSRKPAPTDPNWVKVERIVESVV